jgi:hypothetical protein
MTIADMVRWWGSELEQVLAVAGRWSLQYGRDPGGRTWKGIGTNAEVCDALKSPDVKTAADVAAIIGNDSWVGKRCTFCGEQRVYGFDIGEPDDYESATVSACVECARALCSEIGARLISSPPSAAPAPSHSDPTDA